MTLETWFERIHEPVLELALRRQHGDGIHRVDLHLEDETIGYHVNRGRKTVTLLDPGRVVETDDNLVDYWIFHAQLQLIINVEMSCIGADA